MKKRADQLTVEQGLCESRTQAQRLIQAGLIRIGTDQVINKVGQMIDDSIQLTLITPCPYVSRGAYKLLAGLEEFKPEIEGCIAMDIGASTGGFTDLLLQNGVKEVYAVDVGYGQLHIKLREDPRVHVLERCNARYLTSEHIPEPTDLMVSDVSFISLKKILPSCAPFLKENAWILVLVKPQFEAKREEIGKNGVVRDEAVRLRCVQEVCEFAQQELGWTHVGTVPSPITGPKGNQEYIVAFRK